MSVSDYFRDISLVLSRVMDDIGVNEECVMRRRRTYLLKENCMSLLYTLDKRNITTFHFGSQTEGSTTQDLKSDVDILVNEDDFNIIQEWKDWRPGDLNYLMIQDETTSPGYCKLQALRSDMPLAWDLILPNTDHVYDDKGRVIRSNVQPGMSGTERQGPATTVPATTDRQRECDIIVAYRCQTWPNHYKQWATRREARAWPTPGMIKYMKSSGCFVVPVAHRLAARQNEEWRISTSLAERCLMFHLNITQLRCYVILKMVVKTFIEPYVPDTISSYICKTLLLHALEKTSRDFWTEPNLLLCVTNVLFHMYAVVYCMNCPNYFCGSANLLLGKLDIEKRGRLLFIITILVQSQGRFLLQIGYDGVNSRLAAYISDRHLMLRYEENESVRLYISTQLTLDMVSTLPKIIGTLNIIRSSRHIGNLLSIALEYAKRGAFQNKTARYMIPFLCSHAATIATSERILRGQNVTPAALLLYRLSLDSDAASSRLKFASFLYCTGQYEGTLTCLQEVERIMTGGTAIAVCGCFDQTAPIPVNLDFAMTERQNSYISISNYGLCVMFSRAESQCCPREMQFDFFRSTDEEILQMDEINDAWMDIAVMDCIPYLYYLQYMTARQLGQRDLQYRALYKLIRCAFSEESLGHRETVLNVLGQCMEQENRFDMALLCYRQSLQQRPRNKAVRWHFMRLLAIIRQGR